MKAVFIAPFARYPKATTRARVLPLARAMVQRGHQVTVIVPPYDNPEESGEQLTVGGARVVTLRVDGAIPEQSTRQVVVQPRLAWQAIERALRLTPDVVHVFKPKAVSGLAQLLLWYRRKGQTAPALVLDTDDWEGNGGWNEYELYPWWQKLACDWQERWGLEHADAVTAASRTLEAQAWSHRVPPERVRYVPNGLDPEDYPGWEQGSGAAGRVRLGLGQRPVVLLYTRFFEFEPERAWLVMRQVLRERPDACLLVVGAGKFKQEERLVRLAEADGKARSVHVAGWQKPDALPDLLLAGELALFPVDDNLANRAKCSAKVLETLWLRRAVVADRVGQYAEYVQDGKTGLLCDPARPDSMAAAVLRLLNDRALAERLGAAGRARVLDEFGWEKLAAGAEEAWAAAATARRA